MTYEVAIAARTYKIELERTSESTTARDVPEGNASPETLFKVRVNGRAATVNYVRLGDSLSLIVDGKSFEVPLERTEEGLRIWLRGKTYECTVRDPRSLRTRKRAIGTEGGQQNLSASMPGKVVRVLVHAGDRVAIGQGILVIEAMKMQNEVRSPAAGVLKNLYVKEGANVNAGEVLAVIG